MCIIRMSALNSRRTVSAPASSIISFLSLCSDLQQSEIRLFSLLVRFFFFFFTQPCFNFFCCLFARRINFTRVFSRLHRPFLSAHRLPQLLAFQGHPSET